MYDVELRILPLPQILLVQYVWRSKPFAALQKLQKILYIQNMSYIADALLCTKWVFELQFTKNHFSFGVDLCDNNNFATFCATNAMYLIITSIIFMCNMSYFMALRLQFVFFQFVCLCVYLYCLQHEVTLDIRCLRPLRQLSPAYVHMCLCVSKYLYVSVFAHIWSYELVRVCLNSLVCSVCVCVF